MDGKGGDGEILPMFECIGQQNTLVTFLSMLWITQKFLQIMKLAQCDSTKRHEKQIGQGIKKSFWGGLTMKRPYHPINRQTSLSFKKTPILGAQILINLILIAKIKLL